MKTEDTEKNKFFEILSVTTLVIVMLFTAYLGVRHLLGFMQTDYQWASFNHALNQAAESVLAEEISNIQTGTKLYDISEFYKPEKNIFFRFPVTGKIKINITQNDDINTNFKKVTISLDSQFSKKQFIKPIVLYLSTERIKNKPLQFN